MLRIVCLTIIFVISFHYDMKWNSVCKVEAKSNNNTGNLKSTYIKIKEYVDDIQSYIGFNTVDSLSKKHRVANDFLKYVGLGFEKLKSPRRGYSAKKKKLALTPERKHFDKFKQNAVSAPQILMSHDYNVETHIIKTDDGYKLTVQRILTKTKLCAKKTVMLHHGLFGSSEDWLLLGPGLGLPYLLSDLGYDVWLLNARGNKYSRLHVTINWNSFEFWDFSFHEMGIYDLPACITYISTCTNDTDLYYIGHSMGSTASLVLLSTLPEYNNKLKLVILLAPLAFMSHAKGPITDYEDFQSQSKNNSLQVEERREFKKDKVFPTALFKYYCRGSLRSCSNALLLLANGGKAVSDPNVMENILCRLPAGGSMKTLLHYVQLIKCGCFRMFDYGLLNNLKIYSLKHPAKYNLSAIQTPIALFSSASDWLSNVIDVTKLERQIHSVVRHHILTENDFNHLDFIFSNDAPKLVYYHVMEMLETLAERRNRIGNNFVTRII